MIKVWILATIIYNGHFGYSLVPTLEFNSQAKCEAAVKALSKAVEEKRLTTSNAQCVEIEK